MEKLCALDAKTINNLSNNLRNQLSETAAGQYKGFFCTGHCKGILSAEERKKWLLQYVIDPEGVTSKGFNTVV